MNSNPEYIHELIRKLHSWNIYGQSHERCNAELAAANALQALLTERDEYKRRAEAAEADILEMLIEEGGNLDLCHWCAGNCPDNDYSQCEQKIRWRGPCAKNGGSNGGESHPQNLKRNTPGQ